MGNLQSGLPALGTAIVRAHARRYPYSTLSATRGVREAYAAIDPVLHILLHDALFVPLAWTADAVLGLGPWNRALRDSRSDPDRNPHNPFETVLKHFGTPVRVADTDLAKLPERGPAIMYGLHPSGPLEVLGAMSLALTRRPDVKVVALNEMTSMGGLRDYFLGVDFVSPEPMRTRNNARLRESIKAHLASGGAIVIFPSAKPATRVEGKLWEPPFHPAAAKYGLEFDATMVPFIMDTRLSDAFYDAPARSRFAALWRYALAARQGGRLDFRVGDPVETTTHKARTGTTQTDVESVRRFNDLLRDTVDLLAPDYHPSSFTPAASHSAAWLRARGTRRRRPGSAGSGARGTTRARG